MGSRGCPTTMDSIIMYEQTPDYGANVGPEPTNWEIMRRLDGMGRQLQALQETLTTTYVRKDVYESDIARQEAEEKRHLARIAILENRHEWMIRTIGGTLVTSLISVVITLFRLKA